MLLPRTRIFVVYGHDSRLLDAAVDTIKRASSDGYRVESEVLNEEVLSAERAGSIYEALRRRMSLVDAAIVLATADDMGEKRSLIENIAADETDAFQRLIESLKPRARQNVILELGMLLNQVGDERLLILVDRESDPPSDLVGRFWSYVENEANAKLRIRRFIEQTCLKTSINLIGDESARVDYSDLRHVGDVPLATFTHGKGGRT